MNDFATYTNPQLNRWAAERDGYFDFWTTSDSAGEHLYGHVKGKKPPPCPQKLSTAIPTYATRADLAIALLGRWGYEWTRGFSYPDYTPFVEVYNRFTSHRAHESPDCDTARALVIAANSLKESEGE